MTTPSPGQNERGLEPLLKIVNHKGMVPDWKQANTAAFEALFGGDGRYDLATAKTVKLRAPDMVAAETGVPYAAFIHPSSQDSGAYGGMSFVIFRSKGALASLRWYSEQPVCRPTRASSADRDTRGRPRPYALG